MLKFRQGSTFEFLFEITVDIQGPLIVLNHLIFRMRQGFLPRFKKW